MMRVAIIGAAGYVGMELSKHLRDGDCAVDAITRENGRFLLRNSGFNIVAPEDIGSVGVADVVVNLAYPNSGPLQHYPIRNKEILAQIRAVTGPRTRLIHVSTQAVFGYGFERPPITGPAQSARDYAYVEAKIELENLLLREFESSNIDIVRLGNIWGPGSPTWTVALVNKVLFGEPVGVEGIDGYCNVTDVGNTASYLSFLIGRKEDSGVRFYHLAEMSAYRWSAWIARIETALGQQSVRLSSLPPGPHTLKQEISEALSPLRPGPLYRRLAEARVSGSSLRTLIRGIGDDRFDMVKRRFAKTLPTGYTPTATEMNFLRIMSADSRFETRVHEDWCPPIDFEESWSRVEAWMSAAGYTIRGRQHC